MNRYKVSSIIGEGSFGRVYKATRKDDDQVVAIKVISKRGRSLRDLKNLRRECEIQAKLKHPNIIEMLESFETKNDLIVVTEFALIDLHRFISKNGALNEERAQKLICHLVSAMYYLHSNRILHRDLKPQNVLLNQDLHAKLCDFGLARNMTMGTHVLTSIKGTPLYMAPELLAERPYDYLADLWSLGCISYESMTGQPPFCTTSILHLVKLIKHEEVKWPSTLSNDCKSFLQGLLEKDPGMRATWAQILCHPFVEGKLHIIAAIKAQNSPFINPQKLKNSISNSKTKSSQGEEQTLSDKLADLQVQDPQKSIADNITSSRDSINAIPASDIENFETDVEDALIPLPFTEYSFKAEPKVLERIQMEMLTAPVVNSQTCFVSGNNNMILNNLNDNFASYAMEAPAKSIQPQPVQQTASTASLKKSRSKDLEKRKLSQNLENFSLRLGKTVESEAQRKTNDLLQSKKDKDKCKDKVKDIDKEKDKENIDEQKSPSIPVKNSLQSTDEKPMNENSPPCLLPGWDSCDESQSPPIENEEWLAFLNRSMQEVIDGELESLKQNNLVSIIVAPLRNSKAIPKVINSVAQLLSLPFVVDCPSSVLDIIKTVYVEVKLVPNLMYACKLLVSQKSAQDSLASLQTQTHRVMRSIAELNSEEIKTCSHLYELVCHLVHLKQQFLTQFCDAVAILAVSDLFIDFLNSDFKNASALRLANCILALFCCVLREVPENAELVESIIFHSKLNFVRLLEHNDSLMRTRICMLIRLLARFSLRGLQNIWSTNIKSAIECLADDENSNVSQEAESTLEELRQFSFY